MAANFLGIRPYSDYMKGLSETDLKIVKTGLDECKYDDAVKH